MSNITYNDVEYECRSLADDERKKWDERIRVAAKAIWKPAEDYWRRLGGIPFQAKKYCLAVYLRKLDWEHPPQSVRIQVFQYPEMGVPLLKQLLSVMSPDFPPDLITEETVPAILRLVEPYFIEIRQKG